MNKIINLTQHAASAEQIEQGVFDLEGADLSLMKDLITFRQIPTMEQLRSNAAQLAEIAIKHGSKIAMIGGAPYFMSHLERELQARGIMPAYAFSERVSVDTVQPDGSVVKTAMFKHQGFYYVTREEA